jgi:hypothetical protein
MTNTDYTQVLRLRRSERPPKIRLSPYGRRGKGEG